MNPSLVSYGLFPNRLYRELYRELAISDDSLRHGSR
jgi:hypothetical protein